MVDSFTSTEWGIHFVGTPNVSKLDTDEHAYLDEFYLNLVDQLRAGALVGGYDRHLEIPRAPNDPIVFQQFESVDWESRHLFSGSICGIAAPWREIHDWSSQRNIIPTRNDYFFSDLRLFDYYEAPVISIGRERGYGIRALGTPLFTGRPFSKIAIFVNTPQHAERIQSMLTAKHLTTPRWSSAFEPPALDILAETSIVFWSPKEDHFAAIPSLAPALAAKIDSEISEIFDDAWRLAEKHRYESPPEGQDTPQIVFTAPALTPTQYSELMSRDEKTHPTLMAIHLVDSEVALRVEVLSRYYALPFGYHVAPEGLENISAMLNKRLPSVGFRVMAVSV
ncbi:hypothetical protein [Rhizobium ruizarguesonis]|uniref:hypothetical protein n=1 Tax=Rhizobium ruizarguesonis TaxID=2081791 RepID=UPI0012EC04C6|nr:hypothetical protein [Rhizobium ruizarguesonis]QJS29301.1 hypothetical protein RLTA1_19180 [Rhizobium leguminosarum bv. trifolii TA1]UFW93460.1 hypothetical protein RlegTA1_19140 [Rhizobium ruizarguesonis]